MPQKIYIFKDIDDAIILLSKFNTDYYLPEKNYEKKDIILNSAGGSIFRVFKNLNVRPSDIYKNWANNKFDFLINDLKKINKQSAFDKVVLKYTNSFINHWKTEVNLNNLNIGFGPASKLVNLLIKLIQESHKYKIINITKYQHIPFDSFTLKPLQNIINELISVNYNLYIPSNVSMKYINTPELYFIIQQSIFKLSKMANIRPIVYEYWAWNDKH